MSGMSVFDGMAGVCISGLLAAMGVALAKVNHRFLIGQGIDRTTREDIEKIILSRRSIDNVYSVQSQWTGKLTVILYDTPPIGLQMFLNCLV